VQPLSTYTLESAIEAGEAGTLRDWVIAFLEAEGNNLKLAQGLRINQTIRFFGPKEADLAPMKRMCGSPEEKLQYTDNDWDARVDAMVTAIQQGWNPPPIIISDYYDPEGNLTDGNHRHEALLRAGYTKYWTIYLKSRN